MKHNLEGKTFGEWSVVSSGKGYKNKNMSEVVPTWICKCSCGTEKDVRENSLLRGISKSCGHTRKKHGLSKHRLYGTWKKMIERCTKESCKSYNHYGGRGIKVCDEWLDPYYGIINFVNDMSESFVEGLELDRIDVNGNYSKENCRWATRSTQTINRRWASNILNARMITYNNKTLCVAEWSRELGIPRYLLSYRLNRLGLPTEKAFTIEPRKTEILIHYKCRYFTIKNFFPRTFYYRAKTRKLEPKQYAANLLFGVADVYERVLKENILIAPSEDLSEELLTLNLKVNLNEDSINREQIIV